MVVMGLDISTKTGFAVIKNSKLDTYGIIKSSPQHHAINSIGMVKRAKIIAKLIKEKCDKVKPDKIYVEQTNPGRFRMSQKELEFIHFAFLDAVVGDYEDRIMYVDSSRWRSDLKIRLTKEQKMHNKKVKNKQARGRITIKHLSVNYVNLKYNLKLKLKDNDIADAICIATYGVYDNTKQKKIHALAEAFKK